MKLFKRFAFICLIVTGATLWAGTTGKIAGVVKDSQNGEPLPGVNVLVTGTNLGASTDLDGQFYILNVPPGTYSLTLSYIGYANYTITDVVVSIDLTTKIDVSLVQEILESETVEVVAQRPVIVKDISNSQMNIEAKSIDPLPVQTINEVLTLQAGIESGANGIIIRGGGADETRFMVDGLTFNDERSNYPYSAVGLSSVEEVQVQTGGFNAEYGQARSGVVNVLTKEGSKSKYSATLSFQIQPAQPKHFGGSIYDKYSYFNRPYFDPAVMWTGTNSGGWDEYTRAQYPNFAGWNAVAEALLLDDDPNNDLTPDGAKRLFEWYRRRQGDITKPDYMVDVGFGGPVPVISDKAGSLRFYLTHYNLREMFVFPLNNDSYREHHTQLKLTSDISPNMKLMLTGLYGEVHSVSPYQWTTTPNGYVLRGQEEIANLTNSSNTGMSIPFMPDYFSPSSIYRTLVGVKFNHTLSSATFYEASIQYKYTYNNTYQTALRDTSRRYEIVPGYFVDEAPYGYWGYGTTGVAGMHLGGWMNLGRDKSKNSTTTFTVNLNHQLDRHNFIKTGLEFVYNDFRINSTTESPSMGTWTRSMIYNIYPYRLGLYVQDKLEFEGFIANLGIRLDYSDPNGESLTLEDYDQYYQAGYGNAIEESAPTTPAESQLKISPRLGVSHPISENAKLYFNYGHYVQEPFSSYRFRLQRESNGLVTYLGNPNLLYENTVSYELGFEYNIADIVLLKIAGYYKDITDQPGWIFYQNITGTVQYYKMENNNYADIRGVELTLYKRTGEWFSGFLNYTYDVRTSGYFGLLRYYQDPNEQRDYLRQNPSQDRPHPMPYARANLNFFTPVDFGPEWGFFKPLADWRLNILADWQSGEYETYNPDNIPGVVDDVQWKNYFNVDLRIMKTIDFSAFNIQLYMDIINVFNYKYMSDAGFSDNYDRLNYLESLNFSWEKGDEKGDDRIGDYRPAGVAYDPLEPNPNNDPAVSARNQVRKDNKSYIDMPNIGSLTFLNPRTYRFGLRINF